MEKKFDENKSTNEIHPEKKIVSEDTTLEEGFSAYDLGAGNAANKSNSTFGRIPYEAKDHYKPEDYRWSKPSGRMDQPKREVETAEVGGKLKLKPEDILRMEQRSREESKTLYGAYILREWQKDEVFKKYKNVSFEAIIQAGNISEGIGIWLAKKKADWDAEQKFPAWLLDKGLSKEDLAELETASQALGMARRRKSHFDFKLSEYRKGIADRINANFQNKVYDAYHRKDGRVNWLVVLCNWTVDKLPYDDIFDIVLYQTLDARKSTADILAEKDNYVSPSMYADTVLDRFKKEFFQYISAKGKSGLDFLASKGINSFVGQEKSVGNADLSDISKDVLGVETTT